MLRFLLLAVYAILLGSVSGQFVDWPGSGNSSGLGSLDLRQQVPRSILSNAERLQRGLPLARPKRLYEGTRTGPHLARRSSIPVEAMLNIAIAYRSRPNKIVGYFAIDSGNPSWYGFTDLVPNQSGGDIFTNVPETGSQAIIRTTACPSYNGAQQWNYEFQYYLGGDMGTGDAASGVDGGGGTRMWTWDNVPGEITVEYSNPDGGIGRPKIYLDTNNYNMIFISRSAADVRSQFANAGRGNPITITEADEVLFFWKYTVPTPQPL